MQPKDNQRVMFIQEIYETYEDIKNNNLTLTRIYIIVLFSLMFSFAFLGVIFLFIREYIIVFTYFLFAILFLALILNKKKKFIAKHLNWFCFILGGFTIMVGIAWNIYLFGAAGGAQLYILLLSSLIYVIYIKSNKKRKLAAFISYVILIFFFIFIMVFDSIWHANTQETLVKEILFSVSIFVVLSVNVFGAYTIGLKSIEYIESVSNQKVNFSLNTANDNLKTMCKKDFTKHILQNQTLDYTDLNICIFEFSSINKNVDNFFIVDNTFQEKIINQFLSLLKVYFPENNFIIRWDFNSIILMVEETPKIMYFVLESINKDFDKKIRKSYNDYSLYLKSIVKHYKHIDSKKRPKILLEKINEIIKLKYETKTIGNEYIIYEHE